MCLAIAREDCSDMQVCHPEVTGYWCSQSAVSLQKEPNGVATPKQVASGAVEASNLRSMSETRKAKFKRLSGTAGTVPSQYCLRWIHNAKTKSG